MSIVIHGVSMPKDGTVLLIDPWGNVRLYWSKDVVAVGTGLYLCKASELPPHGRLIDAAVLLNGILSIVFQRSDDPKKVTINANTLLQLVDSLPTIIPADPKER